MMMTMRLLARATVQKRRMVLWVYRCRWGEMTTVCSNGVRSPAMMAFSLLFIRTVSTLIPYCLNREVLV